MMKKAKPEDRRLVTEILAASFADNRSVNYIIPQDEKKRVRIKHLMEYAFDVCHCFGEVFLSDDETACALVLLPDQKKTRLRTIWWDLRFIVLCAGLAALRRVMQREAKIKARQTGGRLYYLWFIGVLPAQQGKGKGSELLTAVIHRSEELRRTICLETSAPENLSWYKKHGFTLYNELRLSYQLFFLKRG